MSDQIAFNQALQIILSWEGGYVNHAKDPGGATKFGITQKTLSQWRNTKVSVQDVQNLTMQEAGEIYKVEYWLPAYCHKLPGAIALAVFDCAVNQGVSRAKRLLQRALGVKVDGSIGPITLAAAINADEEQLLLEFMSLRLMHYTSLKNFVVFGRGWTNRALDVYGRALLLCNFNRRILDHTSIGKGEQQ